MRNVKQDYETGKSVSIFQSAELLFHSNYIFKAYMLVKGSRMLWFCFKNPDGKVDHESYVDL